MKALGSIVVLGSLLAAGPVTMHAAARQATTTATDETLDSRIEKRIHESTLKKYDIDVKVTNGVATLKGTVSNRTPSGAHRILWRIPNETMTSERVYPPIPRDAPGGYYLKNVLFTQYFTSDGASIHYNYWSSNWGYAGSHGCLGVNLADSKWFWDWATIGTPVIIRYS